MNKVLDFFGFGPQLKAWINLFNKGINAAVTQCGFLSNFFPINRGCRQGDPVSSYIFILCAEILSIMIKGNENIKGINIKNIQYLISQFADDTTLMLDGTEKSFKEAMRILDMFARYSGLNLNYTKTKAIWIGSKKFSKDVYHHRIKLDWTQETNKDIDINKMSALFGQPFNDCMCEKNIILLNARFFIYKSKMQNTIPNLNLFKQEFKRYILCEKLIAVKNCNLDNFHKRWSHWQGII